MLDVKTPTLNRNPAKSKNRAKILAGTGFEKKAEF